MRAVVARSAGQWPARQGSGPLGRARRAVRFLPYYTRYHTFAYLRIWGTSSLVNAVVVVVVAMAFVFDPSPLGPRSHKRVCDHVLLLSIWAGVVSLAALLSSCGRIASFITGSILDFCGLCICGVGEMDAGARGGTEVMVTPHHGSARREVDEPLRVCVCVCMRVRLEVRKTECGQGVTLLAPVWPRRCTYSSQECRSAHATVGRVRREVAGVSEAHSFERSVRRRP